MTQDIRPEGPSGDRRREEAAERRKETARRIAGQAGLAVARAVLVVFFLPAFVILFYAVVPPPATPLMIIRAVDGHGISKQWVPLTRISPHLQRAVIAAEDAKFCQHGGFDWAAVDTALTRRREGGRLVGASTISMQTAKNLFLWPARTYFRKGGEAYITVWLETILSKRRILELYLNVVELGPGIYGAEAAARHYFNVSAADLSPSQAAQLASVLPSPLRWTPTPGARSRTIEARARSVTLGQNGPCAR
ncbi:MAG: monofunctional biosynthetic peptidoglycan transglycosylase [Parvibaculum sp.]|nr:monofunctional biosynthetic peptidoglycan transglycosylase [Parvibaculum sp.]